MRIRTFHGQVIDELERLRETDTVRVIDALAVYKDADGEIEVMHLSNLGKEEARELGSKIGALIGLGIEGDAGFEAGVAAGAAAAADQGSEHDFLMCYLPTRGGGQQDKDQTNCKPGC